MSKILPKQEDHPVDIYFREQESSIPVTFDETHWSALQAMLRDANRDGNVPHGNLAPNQLETAPSGTGASKFLIILGIVLFLCSATWVLVAFQENSKQPAGQEPTGNTQPGLMEDQNAPYPANSKPVDQPTEMKVSEGQRLVTPNSNKTMPAFGKAVSDSIQGVTISGKAPLKPDSLLVLPPATAKDSLTIKPKKKKHLFW